MYVMKSVQLEPCNVIGGVGLCAHQHTGGIFFSRKDGGVVSIMTGDGHRLQNDDFVK